ncbi:MAG: ABC transporter permease [Candidatus Avilachnospira sp.]|jgi:putative ABC transport system permease protein
MNTIILGIFEEGLIYAIMSLGVYITYKILDFPDLSVDGTYPLGAAVTATLIAAGANPLVAFPMAFIAGVLAGTVTGVIHVKLKVRDLLSGIIVSLGLYSVNLRVAGTANVSIFSKNSIFSNPIVNAVFPEGIKSLATVIILFVIVIVCKVLLDLYLNTRSGYLLRAAGSNDRLVTALAKDKGTVKILGLAIANGFAALAGGIMCQKQGFFDVNMGTGTVVIGLANVIIGTRIFKNVSFVKATTAVIIGSIIYKACVAIAINCGLNPGDLKLITAVLFLGILVISNMKKERHKKNAQA